MEKSINVVRLFLIGLMLSALVFSPFLLDFTLQPRFICLGFFTGLTFYFIYRSLKPLHLRLDVFTASYIAYGALVCLSLLWAINKAEALFEAARSLLPVFVFLLAYLMLTLQKKYFTNGLLKISVIVFYTSLLVAIYQWLGVKNFDKESMYLITSINGHKNLFASFLFLNLFFLILGAYQLPKAWQFFAVIAIVLSMALLLIIRTKAVWIGLLVSGFVFTLFFLVRFKNKKMLLGYFPALAITLIIANVFFIFLLQPIIQRSIHYTVDNTSPGNKIQKQELDQERLVIWDKTYALFHGHPLLGVGAGNWQVNFPNATLSGLWRAEDLNYTFQRPHNDFLWILSETGLVGLNLFLIFLFSIIFYLVKTLRQVQGDKKMKAELCLCLAFIIGYFTISFFDFPKERMEHLVWINLILAMAYYQIRVNNVNLAFKTIVVRLPVLALTLGLLGFILVIGVLRYKGEFYTRKMLDYKFSQQPALEIEAANAALSFAYTLDPTSVPIYWYIGNAQALLPDHKNTSEAFEKAYALNPYNRNVLNDLGSAYVFNNNSEMAKKIYAEAARISPRFDEPKLNLVAIYIREQNYKAAADCLKTIFHDSERRSSYQRIVEAMGSGR